MSFSNRNNERGPQIRTAMVTDTELMIYLKDGRRIAMPLWWSPRLFSATPDQRDAWAIMPFGDALEWEEIDEHISVRGVMQGGPFPGAVPPPYVSVPASDNAEGSVG